MEEETIPLIPSEEFVRAYNGTDQQVVGAEVVFSHDITNDSSTDEAVPVQVFKLGKDIEIRPGDPNDYAPIPGWNVN